MPRQIVVEDCVCYNDVRLVLEMELTILAGNIPGVTQTIPLAIYDYTNTPGGEAGALSLCLVSIVLSYLVLIFNEWLLRRARRGEAA